MRSLASGMSLSVAAGGPTQLGSEPFLPSECAEVECPLVGHPSSGQFSGATESSLATGGPTSVGDPPTIQAAIPSSTAHCAHPSDNCLREASSATATSVDVGSNPLHASLPAVTVELPADAVSPLTTKLLASVSLHATTLGAAHVPAASTQVGPGESTPEDVVSPSSSDGGSLSFPSLLVRALPVPGFEPSSNGVNPTTAHTSFVGKSQANPSSPPGVTTRGSHRRIVSSGPILSSSNESPPLEY